MGWYKSLIKPGQGSIYWISELLSILALTEFICLIFMMLRILFQVWLVLKLQKSLASAMALKAVALCSSF